MRSLYVMGGRQRKSFENIEAEWFLFEKALVLRVDTETGKGEVCLEYETPLEARASEKSSVMFKSGSLKDNRLYLCTSTEVMIYEVPSFKRLAYISLPCFNDLHHVCPAPNGNLMIAATGMDMVLEITPEGKVVREWSALGDDPWQRFSREVDYRKVATNKPYRAHANYVFWIGDEPWVGRSDLKDAVSLENPRRRIDVGINCVHDGIPFNGSIYFTTVDGNLVAANPDTLRVDRVIDLKTIDNPNNALLGFCRGIFIEDEKKFWIGFTRVRQTKWKEKVAWIKRTLIAAQKPTHLALYDIERQRLLKEINLENFGMNAVFNMFPTENALPTAAKA
ncbi:MAG TPA: hypothetical protein VKV79_07960 [Terriglobia bacterium]|nr:hypothetical protein [Terriglobia bacterium]